MRKLSVLLLVSSICVLTGCSKDPSEVTFSLVDLGEVSIHTENQNLFLNDDDFSNDLVNYANATQKYDNPLPVSLSWDISSKAKKYVINVSENNDMSDAWSFESKENSYDLYNCKINTTYYWNVTAYYSSVNFSSNIATFKVKDKSLRNIYIDGVDNVRDLGGYVTSDNKVVKQGLIYRTARFNDSSTDEVTLNITEEGLKTVNEQLRIKTDIDVRKNASCDSNEIGGLTSSPLGSGVNYLNYPMYFEGQNIFNFSGDADKKAINDASIKSFFETLANEDNYPIVFHCTQGKDRTGALAYALEALLGVSQEDMIHDYLFTNFARLGSSYVKTTEVTANTRIGGCINNASGDNLKEKAFNYLNSLGISEDTLTAIIDILTE